VGGGKEKFLRRKELEHKGDKKDERRGGAKGGRGSVQREEWQEVERWEKIKNSRYNRWYGRMKGKGVPEYLKRRWKEERWQRVARFTLGDGMRGGTYWEGEEERKCRVCGWGKKRGSTCGWNVRIGEWRGDGRRWWTKCWERGGEGEVWMERLEELREIGMK